MSDFKRTLEGLRQERRELRNQLSRLDEAIDALEKVLGAHSATSRGARAPRRRRRLSAAARERIAAAQRARWAKVRQQKAGGKERKAAKAA